VEGMAILKSSSYDDDPEMDQWVDSILRDNQHLNFVDRIMRPELYPTLPYKNGILTHLMSWEHIDGKPAVYPRITFDHNAMQLKELSPDDAYKHAVKNKEYIPFESEEEADLFSQQYKRHWRSGKGPKGYK